MNIYLKNVGIVKESNIVIDGLTVIKRQEGANSEISVQSTSDREKVHCFEDKNQEQSHYRM